MITRNSRAAGGRTTKVLFIGDVVGQPGRDVLCRKLPAFIQENSLDLVVANGENATSGSGLQLDHAEQILDAGVDVITLGDHTWGKKEINKVFERYPDSVIRPVNFSPRAPGKGIALKNIGDAPVAVINVIGRVFMSPSDCPFRTLDAELESLPRDCKVIIVDLHAEATSEKKAFGYYFDGRVSAVIGTHTHVPTADEGLLAGGTAYITDAGMTGSILSVIGRKTENVIERFLTGIPVKMEVAEKKIEIQGILLEIDPASGKALWIQRITL